MSGPRTPHTRPVALNPRVCRRLDADLSDPTTWPGPLGFDPNRHHAVTVNQVPEPQTPTPNPKPQTPSLEPRKLRARPRTPDISTLNP
jgi:hypothetical protein